MLAAKGPSDLSTETKIAIAIPTQFALLLLPSEIRMKIYGYVFEGSKITNYNQLTVTGEEGDQRPGVRFSSHHAILRTCKMCYNEAIELFYSSTTWNLQQLGVGRVLNQPYCSVAKPYVKRVLIANYVYPAHPFTDDEEGKMKVEDFKSIEFLQYEIKPLPFRPPFDLVEDSEIVSNAFLANRINCDCYREMRERWLTMHPNAEFSLKTALLHYPPTQGVWIIYILPAKIDLRSKVVTRYENQRSEMYDPRIRALILGGIKLPESPEDS